MSRLSVFIALFFCIPMMKASEVVDADTFSISQLEEQLEKLDTNIASKRSVVQRAISALKGTTYVAGQGMVIEPVAPTDLQSYKNTLESCCLELDELEQQHQGLVQQIAEARRDELDIFVGQSRTFAADALAPYEFSASQMQRIVRGRLARQEALRVKREKDEAKRQERVLAIQSFWRGELARRYVDRLREQRAHEEAVRVAIPLLVKLQTHFRLRIAREVEVARLEAIRQEKLRQEALEEARRERNRQRRRDRRARQRARKQNLKDQEQAMEDAAEQARKEEEQWNAFAGESAEQLKKDGDLFARLMREDERRRSDALRAKIDEKKSGRSAKGRKHGALQRKITALEEGHRSGCKETTQTVMERFVEQSEVGRRISSMTQSAPRVETVDDLLDAIFMSSCAMGVNLKEIPDSGVKDLVENTIALFNRFGADADPALKKVMATPHLGDILTVKIQEKIKGERKDAE